MARTPSKDTAGTWTQLCAFKPDHVMVEVTMHFRTGEQAVTCGFKITDHRTSEVLAMHVSNGGDVRAHGFDRTTCALALREALDLLTEPF